METLGQLPYTVYFLVDPSAPRWPRYVGMTQNIAERERSHRQSRMNNRDLASWKDALRCDGRAPQLIPYRHFASESEARAFEWRLMRRWRRRGLCDCNTARDGALAAWGLWMDARNERLAHRRFA